MEWVRHSSSSLSPGSNRGEALFPLKIAQAFKERQKNCLSCWENLHLHTMLSSTKEAPMPMATLFQTIADFTEQFKRFFQQRKKVAALQNLSEVSEFEHKHYLSLIKACMQDGFLGEKEADFLDHMLTTYEINYLDW